MTKCIYCYLALGKDFKERVIKNITSFPGYDFFDILILTDDVAFFDGVKSDRVFIMDIVEYRNLYPKLSQFEALSGFGQNQKQKFSFHLQRFVLKYEHIDKYEIIVLADCDVVPLFTEETYQQFLENFAGKTNCIGSNRAFYEWKEAAIISWAKRVGNLVGLPLDESKVLCSFDGPLKALKLENKEMIEKMFDVWDTLLYEAFTDSSCGIAIRGSWCYTSEILLAVLYNLLKIDVISTHESSIALTPFKAFTYPEDRFWDDIGFRGFITTTNSKEEFVVANYEKLKEFYKEYGQPFPY